MEINIENYMQAAVDWVMEICGENRIKYRYADFRLKLQYAGISFLKKNLKAKNTVEYRGSIQNPTAIIVTLSFDCENNGKKLKAMKNNFYEYVFCRVGVNNGKDIAFHFTVKELDIRLVGSAEADEDKVESIIKRVQKLLALADTERNPSEQEAMAASMQAQRLLAKYNLDVETVTGKPKEEEIQQVVADVGTGNKWKFELAEVIARSYCCKVFYIGRDQVVFYGYKSDTLIARRVYMYLFNVGNKLGRKYVKDYRDANGWAPDGLYNDYVFGFTHGIDGELSRQCRALALVVPARVQDEYKDYTKNFGSMDTSFKRGGDYEAYQQGKTDGRQALNAQYIGTGKGG